MTKTGQLAVAPRLERPLSVDDLSGIVRAAGQSGQMLSLRGGGTRASFSNRGPAADIELDLTGLDGVIDYSPVDLTLAVGAGARLGEIDRLLGENGQRLVLDAPLRDRATVGGTFASGLSGPRRLRYGSLKDMVIGSEVVNSRGELTKSGGMVVKNVSGYEISRLHYGAHGAFGIVTRLNLKVLPVPESRVEVLARYDDIGASSDAAASILVSTLDPVSVFTTRDNGHCILHVQLEGSAHFTSAQSERVVAHLERLHHPISTDVVPVEGTSTPPFDDIADLVSVDGTIVVRLSIPASRQAGVLTGLEVDANWQVLADAGSGLIYVRAEASPEARDRFVESREPVTFLALPEELRSGIDVFGTVDRVQARVLERLKNEYDPARIFNPGRFVSFL